MKTIEKTVVFPTKRISTGWDLHISSRSQVQTTVLAARCSALLGFGTLGWHAWKYVIIYIIFNWISVYKISGPWDLQHLSGLFRWLRTPMIIVSIAWRRVLDLSPHFLDGDLIYLNILYISLAFHGVHPSPAWVVGSSCCPLANQQFATENGPVIGWSTENGDSPVRKL